MRNISCMSRVDSTQDLHEDSCLEVKLALAADDYCLAQRGVQHCRPDEMLGRRHAWIRMRVDAGSSAHQ